MSDRLSGPHRLSVLGAEVAARLERWLGSADRWVRSDDAGRSWYGAGYPGWGIQTLYPYLGAATMVAQHGSTPEVRAWARDRAESSLRYALDSHVSGGGVTADGRPWEPTWISSLGPERAGFALDLLEPGLPATDAAGLRRLRLAEADWLTDDYVRGPHRGIHGGKWGSSGKNAPESNIWNGTALWRTAMAYADAPRAADYRRRAVEFLLNGISVSADADSDEVVDGIRVGDVHRGANFFDSLSLDHHAYMNVGYLVICASNAAMAHIDFVERGWDTPEALAWRQDWLWRTIKPLIGPDGRLLRPGGDSRVRYAYCQEYLLPTLLYADRVLGDPDARGLTEQVLRLGMREQDAGEDGSFYGGRLAHLARRQPYYYQRMETDRALTWAWWLRWAGSVEQAAAGSTRTGSTGQVGMRPAADPLPGSVAEWHDQEHGFAYTRGPGRVASVCWRAHSLSQTLVLPTDRPDLAEWSMNLAPVLHWEGAKPAAVPTESAREHRRLGDYRLATFPGGFASVGVVGEGHDLFVVEGWHSPEGTPAATTTMAVVALPDDATVVGLQLCRAGTYHAPLLEAYALNLLLPNDVYTPRERSLVEVPCANGAGLRIDDALEVRVSGNLAVRHPEPGAGLRSITVDQVVADERHDAYAVRPGRTILDTAWAIRVGATEPEAFTLDRRHLDDGRQELRIRTPDGEHVVTVDPAALTVLVGGEPVL
ncbi:hypothetical protein [Parenemella sanctibonifatiensis]|uniref:Uncharacterized protein n=1 Tax=Parenemella sanctibonifatiensis TaxID=2016505 RepID=A0A255EMA5_9ACTN|nr:hypothetical protein [Parenemella sanctibonifatiensis]OYN92667.1 hypothetical protein CGZ91_04140 [Parenemella sanctibonifatiensis]